MNRFFFSFFVFRSLSLIDYDCPVVSSLAQHNLAKGLAPGCPLNQKKKRKIKSLNWLPPLYICIQSRKEVGKNFKWPKYRERVHTQSMGSVTKADRQKKKGPASLFLKRLVDKSYMQAGCYSSSSSAKTFFFFSIFSFRLLNGSQTSSIFIRCHLRFPPLQLSCCCSGVVFRCCERRARGSGY